LKDGISEGGNLRAGVPQGSVLVPLLFLVYVNDIVDEVLGLCTLFADDTSIGHSAHDEHTLVNLTDIDLSNLSKWSEQWLVKLHPDKTDIMVFSIRNRDFNSNLNINNIQIDPVASHRHLGVYFSSDFKWTIHINKIIEKASKQLNVLRKLKFKLDREYLERIYLTFILPILEYSCEVWDNCGQMECRSLRKNQSRSCQNYYRFDYILKQSIIISRNGLGKTINQTRTVKTCFILQNNPRPVS
jgi:hypothetical protein